LAEECSLCSGTNVISLFLTDPFKIGPALPLTEKQKAEQKLDVEWEAAGAPSLDERIEDRNRIIGERLKRAFEEK
jgi:hypothetical protein